MKEIKWKNIGMLSNNRKVSQLTNTDIGTDTSPFFAFRMTYIRTAHDLSQVSDGYGPRYT